MSPYELKMESIKNTSFKEKFEIAENNHCLDLFQDNGLTDFGKILLTSINDTYKNKKNMLQQLLEMVEGENLKEVEKELNKIIYEHELLTTA